MGHNDSRMVSGLQEGASGLCLSVSNPAQRLHAQRCAEMAFPSLPGTTSTDEAPKSAGMLPSASTLSMGSLFAFRQLWGECRGHNAGQPDCAHQDCNENISLEWLA